MSELKTCPFCGGEDLDVHVAAYFGRLHEDVTITCNDCLGSIYGSTEERAIVAWNTRHVETCTIGDYKDPDYGYTHTAMWNDEWFMPSGRCSGCGEYIPVWNYCPKCGRKVEG